MRSIIEWNLRQRKWMIIWWCLGIALFIILEVSVYPSVKSQAAQLNEALDKLPESVKSLFGASGGLFTPVGYLSSRLFYLLLPMLLSILTIGLGSSLLAREETDRTIELLLARPISRTKLLFAKLISGLSVLLIVSTVSAVVILVSIKIVDLAVPASYVAFAMLMTVLIAALFGMIAFFITCMGSSRRGAAIGVSALVALGGYIIASLESDVHWLHWPAKLWPYHYYNSSYILSGHYAWGPLILFICLISILVLLSWRSFKRRDING